MQLALEGPAVASAVRNAEADEARSRKHFTSSLRRHWLLLRLQFCAPLGFHCFGGSIDQRIEDSFPDRCMTKKHEHRVRGHKGVKMT